MSKSQRPPSVADRTLLRACRAWGSTEFDRSMDRFSPEWRDRIRSAWTAAIDVMPEVAWRELRRDHRASARPDPARVHPSWYVRALKGESPAVHLAVAAHAQPPVRKLIRRVLQLDGEQLEPDRPCDPEALGWALALWTERLLGDVHEREDDPPVVVALTTFGPYELARLIKACGLAKHAFAMDGRLPSEKDEEIARFNRMNRGRIGYFRRHIGTQDPRLNPLAKLDFEAIDGDHRRAHLRMGLLTFGRLLAGVEPHRGRWALQHIPYELARLMRMKTRQGISYRSLHAWESWVLESAWARLHSEGRLTSSRKHRNGFIRGEWQ